MFKRVRTYDKEEELKAKYEADRLKSENEHTDILNNVRDILDEKNLANLNSKLDTSTDGWQEKNVPVQNYPWLNIWHDLSRDSHNPKEFKYQTVRQEVTRNFTVSCNYTGSSGLVYITYSDYEDRLKDWYPSFQETMDTRSDPRLPCSFIVGNRVTIEFRSNGTSPETNTNQEKFKKIVTYLKTKTDKLELSDLSDIVYSVTGDIPLNYTVKKFNLNHHNLNSLIQLTNEEFYSNTLKMRKLLEISTKSINLKRYFRPLFERLVHMRKFVTKKYNGYFKSLIELVVKKVLDKVEKAAEKIKEGANYQVPMTYLQTVYTSFILNQKEMSDYMDELMSLITNSLSEIRCYEKRRNEFTENWKHIIQINIKLSVTDAFQRLQNDVNLIFNKDNLEMDNRQLLTKHFQSEIYQKLKALKENIEDKAAAQQSYEQFIKKNIRMDVIVDHSNTIKTSSVSICARNERPCPLLTRAENIRSVEPTTATSITIEWDFKNDELVTSYIVYYRCTSDETSTDENLHSIKTKSKKARISSIASGKYVFRIQAQFQSELLGAPSEESQEFLTLQEKQPTIDESNYCSICMEKTKEIAFVPCGHCICESCTKNVSETCHICCQPIENKIKLYYNC